MSLRRLLIMMTVVSMAVGAAPLRGTSASAALAPQTPPRRQARASWWDRAPIRRSRFYDIKTDLPIEDARAYGRHLDRMYEEYGRRLASMEPRAAEKLQVYIFTRQDEYVRTLRMRFATNATGTGGMFFVAPQGGSGLAFWTEGLPKQRIHHVIQHEGFHQFAYGRFGGDLPMWVNEGLAEFFGTAVLFDDTLILGQSSPHRIDSLKNAIEKGRTLPFREMLTLDNKGWNDRVHDGGAGTQYEQAWSMVHFLVYGDGERYQRPFEQYLRLINQGLLAEPAWSDVFGPDISAFEERWRAYALAAQPAAFVTALERLDFLAAGALEAARAGVRPESLEALREALRERAFSITTDRHGRPIVLSADEDDNFTIPRDQLAREEPSFVIEAPSPGRLNKREREQEARHPTPCSVRTVHLEPRNLTVRWIRDRESGALRYEIVTTR